MNKSEALKQYARQVEEIKAAGTYKAERVLTGPQGGRVDTAVQKGVINLCANNYLGLCGSPRVMAAAGASYAKWGYGLSSVRFICGTQQVHKRLEEGLARFLGTDDAILYSSCFDANGGLFEVLLGEEDAVISDELNHASIIDGIRLCKARRWRYGNNNMDELERCLIEAKDARVKLIATDGVFSMDGIVADLASICDLADSYGALVMVDDSHAVGFMGRRGRGTPEHCGVEGRVDIITGTLGKAMGGASGGYTAARREIVELLRQRSRPYLFSNTLAPAIAEASLEVLEIAGGADEERARLWRNTETFRSRMAELGYDVVPGEHPIVAVMLYDAALAGKVAARLLELGVYVIPFSFPVVPKGKARIRVQLSAAHTGGEIEQALEAFAQVRRELL